MICRSIATAVLSVLVLQGCASGGGPDIDESNLAPKLENGSLNATCERWAYDDAMSPGRYANVFRLSNGRALGIYLAAKTSKGFYAGEEIYLFDFTNPSQPRFTDTPVESSAVVEIDAFSFAYRSFPSGKDRIITVSPAEGGTVARISLLSLCRMRFQKVVTEWQVASNTYKIVRKTGDKHGFLFFTPQAAGAALDPEATLADMSPKYVVELKTLSGGADADKSVPMPIGDTGYVVHFDGSGWSVGLAR